jgi:hypothetical protein
MSLELKTAPWNSGSCSYFTQTRDIQILVRFSMFSVSLSASRSIFEAVPHCKLRLLHPTFFVSHPRYCSFFFHEHMHLTVTTWLKSTHQGRTNSACLFTWATEFCKVAPHTFSTITAVSSLTYKCVSLNTHTPRIKAPFKINVHKSLQNCSPQYAPRFISPFWHLEFGSGS